MANYKQPGHASGTYSPGTVTATCPLDGLAGRPVGSSNFRFRDDNNHYFDSGATAIKPPITPRPVVQEEPGAKMFFDDISGAPAKP